MVVGDGLAATVLKAQKVEETEKKKANVDNMY
jgi:hypothetical protein